MANTKHSSNTPHPNISYWFRVVSVAIFLILGVAFILYAATSHRITVFTEKKIEFKPPPPELSPEEMDNLSDDEVRALLNPDPIIEIGLQPADEPEPVVVKGVTIGMFEMLPSGEIKNAFAKAEGIPEDEVEEIPETCPT